MKPGRFKLGGSCAEDKEKGKEKGHALYLGVTKAFVPGIIFVSVFFMF